MMDYKEFFTTDNKSGWKCVERKLNNNFPEICELVVKYGRDNELSNLKFVRQVWHFINNVPKIPICKECSNHAKFLRLESGYQEFCCVKCSNKNINKINVTKTNLMDKHGVDSSFKIPDVKRRIAEINIKNFGFDNPFKNKDVQERIHDTFLEKYGDRNILNTEHFKSIDKSRVSSTETMVANKINGLGSVIISGKTFDIKVLDDIFEVDGDYFHSSKLEGLSLVQLNTVLNDRVKRDMLNNSKYVLHRVKVSAIKALTSITVDSLKDISYLPDYSVSYSQKIITKEYLINFINKKGVDKLASYLPLFLRFIRTFQPELPYPDRIETLDYVREYINDFDFSRFHDKETNEFFNGTSVIGCNYLKSSFKSFWSSSYHNRKSPIEIWGDDGLMLKVIAYRIGINKSGEVYDFSMRNLIKGISAIRGTISFFKPLVAAGIYRHYLGDIKEPTVFDPCCGFGGRLLGFKSLYPDGVYVGCEPNVNTYNELVDLGGNFSNISIYNCKLEDFNGCVDYDIAFTSIPYFDLEDYNNGVEYYNFNDWVSTFISKLLTYPRLIINMPKDLCMLLGLDDFIDGYLVNNRSHLSKDKEYKREVLLKINF